MAVPVLNHGVLVGGMTIAPTKTLNPISALEGSGAVTASALGLRRRLPLRVDLLFQRKKTFGALMALKFATGQNMSDRILAKSPGGERLSCPQYRAPEPP